MECLVTKLKSAVSNENLPVFGKIRLWVPTNDTLSNAIFFRLGANSDGPVKIESIPSGFRLYTNNVEITSFPYSLNAGTSLSFRYTNTNTTNPVVLSGVENISFASFSGGSDKYFTIVPEEFYQIRNMTGCEIQNVKDRNGGPLKLSMDYLQKVIDPANFTNNLYAYLTGNLDELPANFFDNAGVVSSRDLNIGQSSTEVTGNLTRFSKIKARKIYIRSIGLSGDIKDIKLDSICTTLIWNYTSTNISGDILSFVLTSLIPTGVQSGLEVGSISRNGTIKFNNNNNFTINNPKLYWNNDGTKVFLRSGDGGKTIICYGYDDSEITSLRSSDPLWTTATTVTSVGTTPAI